MREHGVTRYAVIGSDMATSRRVIDFAAGHDGAVAAGGIHPHEAKGFREGDLAEIAEFVCRIYGWTLHHVLCEVPAVQVALVYRCWQQTAGGLKSATLEMDEIADEMGW